MNLIKKHNLSVFVFILLITLLSLPGLSQSKKSLTFEDVMKFKAIHDPVISVNGQWLAFQSLPDRGDGEVVVIGLKNGKRFLMERAARPQISKNERWVAAVLEPPAAEIEKTGKDKHKPGMVILNTRTGEIKEVENIKQFSFSDDSLWLAYRHHEIKKDKQIDEEAAESKKNSEKSKPDGTLLVLHKLDSGEKIEIQGVLEFAFAPSSRYIAWIGRGEGEKIKGVYLENLKDREFSPVPLLQKEEASYSSLSWHKQADRLAFLAKEEPQAESFSVYTWDDSFSEPKIRVKQEDIPEGWYIPEKNSLSWSEKGGLLFFGLKPLKMKEWEREKKEEESSGEVDLFDIPALLQKREVDVWHWNDPLINPHQKKNWPRIKDKTYLAVHHLDTGNTVPLADEEMPEVRLSQSLDYALGMSDIPYRKELTWYGRLNDIYLIDLKNGSRRKVASCLEDRFQISPGGEYIVYYKNGQWYLFENRTAQTRNLTEALPVSFADEDHDYPSKPPSYGIAGWLEGDKAVFIYDKYDIWQFSTEEEKVVNLTGSKGREEKIIFRVIDIDPEEEYFPQDEPLLLSSYREMRKNYGFYSCFPGKPGIKRLLEEEKKFQFIAKAEKADSVIYTRESFREFPDIWLSSMNFKNPRRVTDINPQIKEFLWGEAELVSWMSLDGIPLQGVLLKPENHQPGEKLPVIVYFYRFFSQRLHEFNQPVINHRPCFPYYTSNGYAIFLPDIRFEVGRPGFSATKCLVPGVQKLIDMGVADPGAIGLHGHSWSGYQTAFVITQTDIFACAVAGAPVSNMTSAYSGIRWGSGLARQFQYEKSQSRIGGSLWEYPERYIENSPVFFADRIRTPLLIMFGDEDGAVPWYQGIELYLAMRRLEKDCIFLQYRGEPHHLQKYPNKLDYAMKMKEYFDHYLKGEPAADWITEGVPYRK